MSPATVERAIWRELREITCNKKLRLKDITEWRTSEFQSQEGEKLVFLPGLKVWVAYKEN